MSTSATKSVSFLSSITTKVTLALLLAFGCVIATLVYVVDTEGYDKIRKQTDKLMAANGESAVDVVSFNISSVMRSAAQLRDTSQILPLEESLFQNTLDSVFDEKNYELLSSGGIWPDAFKLDPEIEILPMLRSKKESGYVPIGVIPTTEDYTNAPWFQLVKSINPQTCIWNHVQTTTVSGELAISCALAINREGEFWGATSVSFNLDAVQQDIETLNNQLGKGYAVLIDNSNQIVASSDPSRLPYIDATTKQPIVLKDYIKTNAAWQPVVDAIQIERQRVIDDVTPKLNDQMSVGFDGFDVSTQSEKGSMHINYAAYLQNTNPNIGNLNRHFLGAYSLFDDQIYRNDSQAYVFNIPETGWKLVIVKPVGEVEAIADTLSKNLIKYMMFALIATAGMIFLLLDYLALRPLQETTTHILQADELINKNQYNSLDKIKFSHVSNDEIGIVNRSLGALLERIQSNEGQLADINQQLEIKVQQRTAELQDTLKELKNSQVQLIRSEKMATLGQMVAGVAHEVNTPLSYVQNNLEIIGQLMDQYEELIEMVSQLKVDMTDQEGSEEDIERLMSAIIASSDEIQKDDLSEELKELIKDSLFGVEQITEMVLNLRNFARLDESKVKKIDIEECVKSSLKIARNSIKQHKIVTNFRSTPEIKCSPSQINQVLVNLFNNAAQAIGDKPDGKILVSTSHDDANVYIDVKDNGSGMNDEVMSKIFEPFFTTKPAGEGTGLGMAISHQIMEQHNGDIQVKSTEGVGTVFRLILPIDNAITDGDLT